MGVVPVILLCTIYLPGILSTEDKGTVFLTAFPENVAFYDPINHEHILSLTALYDNTKVNVTVASNTKWSGDMNAKHVEYVHLSSDDELGRETLSQKSVVIRASKDIVVLSKMERRGRQQRVVVQPTTSLGSLYYTPDLSSYGSSGNGLGFQDFPGAKGKIVVINSDKANVVKVSSSGQTEKRELEPFQVFQMNSSDFQPVKIDAEERVAVLLTHPCAKTSNCTCEMMAIQLRPANTWGENFLLLNAENETVAVTSDKSFTLEAQSLTNTASTPSPPSHHFISDLKSQWVKSSRNSSLMLLQPGNIIQVIPKSHFAACFLTSKRASKALVIVPDSEKNNVRLCNGLLPADWNQFNSSLEHARSVIDLDTNKVQIIWHPSAKIMVYVKHGEKWREAHTLSTEPDPHGCLLEQEVYSVTEQSGTWAESIRHCQEEQSELVSINYEEVQQTLSERLSNPAKAKDAWVGLRRRLVNGEWYWLNKLPVNTAKWEQGQPGHAEEKFCASMTLRGSHKNSWKSRSCCDNMRAVCYKRGVYLPLEGWHW